MILIDNATQSEPLTMPECIETLERAFGAIDSGQAIYRPKTDYYCHGNQGLQFAAVGGVMYRNAIAAGRGTLMPLEWFLQSQKM